MSKARSAFSKMPQPRNKLSRFSGSLWLSLAAFVVFALIFVVYVFSEKQIDHANAARHRALRLADELRQSSDDLTRMVRTYVITGNPLHKKHYQEILDIRDGKVPRPVDYQRVYWDLVLADDHRPRPSDGRAVALLDMMREAGFSAEEFAKLAEAKAQSDALTHIEFTAMALAGAAPPSGTDRREADRMLHGEAYHQAKAAIMRPIGEAYEMADARTLQEVGRAEDTAALVRMAFILFGGVVMYTLLLAYRALHGTLGGSPDEVHAQIARLGDGEFAPPIAVAAGRENSVLGRLAATQARLAALDAERHDSEARNRRLTRLYAALSQCNQAIVRCRDETELFPEICRIAVEFGGMRMAWIGLLDDEKAGLSPVAAHGEGMEYLDGLRIPVNGQDRAGQGPTGNAIREDRPVWCQDFSNDPATAPWHERGARFGWRASASLPLHRGQDVIGAFSLYAGEENAFDEAARNLLLEMALDIDHALGNFERETLRKRAEEALRQSEQRLRTVIETEPECVKLLDGKGNLLEMNPAGLAMLEVDSLEQARQHPLLHYVLPEYRSAFTTLHRSVMRGENATLEFEIQGIRGTRRWLETHAAPMRDADGRVAMLLGITRDISERKRAEARIQYLAHYDALTDLPNRINLEERAKYAISLSHRSHGRVALMFIDLDHFKDINDTLGHSVGDGLLVILAKRLRQALREEDVLSRMGGDEFIILLPGVDARGAAQVAQKILETVARPCRVDPYDLSVSASIGIALYPEDGPDLETLSKNADTAMYRAKLEGRHGYRFFTAEMQASSARNLQLVNALRSALEREQFQVHYQPQISLGDGRVVGAEALLRWRHPDLGSVSPAEFIPVAEDSGLILPIGEWVLRQTVRQTKAWLEQGLGPLIVAVNLSAVQFRHHDLPDLVTRILEEEGVPPEYLELELTEGVAMHDPQGAIAVMGNLHERGVRMSIDDFGTGYSSLSQLKKFRVYKLKIDQSFVRDISTDPEDKAIVAAIIQMAKSLGLQTIAEGVETAGQLAFLREQGCEEAQGYFYSRPLPAEEFTAFVKAGLSAAT